MAKINPIQLQKHLKGMTYPASKQDILTKAQENGGDEQIRSVLQALPEKQYTRPTDVTAAVKDIDNS
ncbi:DUF2795 domain-containing protein [Deinococcus peraridilitoris]|uniref:DUF2795 domain-containing protein n=1 Tax=Deinococcus peraridilitoris (strain DSM 19664 / LMG 22246 / CIP 109416 / KR-200) TaxID=937777 RepID=K9ZYZ4_DEIPD|nr:DUF2795 domain-containing protein [Deinococcus peraridilitoris]AFZ66816.1 Protein of unknown function (DUF2795) [Deinococcus peraridilitoris DSM 19664]